MATNNNNNNINNQNEINENETSKKAAPESNLKISPVSGSIGTTSRSRRVALITGITGQDGSYLAELLISKGYEVHGIVRRSSSFNTKRIEHLYSDRLTHSEGRMKLHYGDLTDSTNLVKLVYEVQPDEVYNLGAQSHVKVSFDLAEYTAEVDAVGTLRLLDAIRTTRMDRKIKYKLTYNLSYFNI